MSSEVTFDIVDNILSRLPANSLIRFRSVCKAWKSIIDDPIFVKSHTKNQHSSSILIRNRYGGGALFCLSLDRGYYEFHVITLKHIIHRGVPRLSDLPAPSCNGLILIPHHDMNKSWAIWNPLLQDFHLLPQPPPPETGLNGGYGYKLARCGFGYDEGSDDYKVVRVDQFYDYYSTRVYSLKSRSWRKIDFPGGDYLGKGGVFLDGALHWRWRDGISMVVLDLGREEVHRLVAGPPPPSEGRRCWESLDALDGCLIWSYVHQNGRGMEAWVMEDYGTEEKSWKKLFSVKTTGARGMRIVGYLKSKGQVFLQHSWGNGLRWLHFENKCSRSTPPFSFSFAQFSPLSLVRLDDHKNTRGVVKRKREKAYARSNEIVYYYCNQFYYFD